MKSITKEQLWDYLILVSRVWLAYILIYYGWGKLTGGQFGVTEATLNLPLKNVDLFRLSWYLADHEPFKSFVGMSQIITAVLLLYNRTVIIGAFMSIPIWLNILMWDMSFMGLYTPFSIRMPYYLLLTVLILWHYKDKVLAALRTITKGISTKFKYPIWAYLLLPLFGFLIEFIGTIPNALITLFQKFYK